MKKITFYLVALSLVFVFTSCQKEQGPRVNDRGLTPEIESIVPEWALDTLENFGMLIHGGTTPPDISGSYVASIHELLHSNISDDVVGRTFTDFYFSFKEINMNDLTLKFDSQSGPEIMEGMGAYIIGTGKQFSVFLLKEAEEVNSGTKAHVVCVISGIWTNNGISNYQNAILMIDDQGDPADYFIENGQGRIFIDGDGLAEAI